MRGDSFLDVQVIPIQNYIEQGVKRHAQQNLPTYERKIPFDKSYKDRYDGYFFWLVLSCQFEDAQITLHNLFSLSNSTVKNHAKDYYLHTTEENQSYYRAIYREYQNHLNEATIERAAAFKKKREEQRWPIWKKLLTAEISCSEFLELFSIKSFSSYQHYQASFLSWYQTIATESEVKALTESLEPITKECEVLLALPSKKPKASVPESFCSELQAVSLSFLRAYCQSNLLLTKEQFYQNYPFKQEKPSLNQIYQVVQEIDPELYQEYKKLVEEKKRRYYAFMFPLADQIQACLCSAVVERGNNNHVVVRPFHCLDYYKITKVDPKTMLEIFKKKKDPTALKAFQMFLQRTKLGRNDEVPISFQERTMIIKGEKHVFSILEQQALVDQLKLRKIPVSRTIFELALREKMLGISLDQPVVASDDAPKKQK